MARRKGKKGRRGGSKKMPLAIIAPMAFTGYEVGKYVMAGDMANAKYMVTGIDSAGKFKGGRVVETYLPIAAGVIVHKGAAALGVNRYIPKWLPVSI